ncbi:hypothetical protein HO173_008956 [Letharia columbiana]|uniref:Uncharacterized protein n=1 Tax=Letharia columbiana TaxID=112416 RepID=A0A8H6FQ86_9LECA|nr:uncharacterized protein HO173_008956 [Letharia columbiana]KAF6232742.1 hypothetical protein HO173_008956 [Letharia columbiana]
MNWTGGALSRSRNANAKVSLSVKQKNHFAKARVNLQNGQRPSPPQIQYFDFGEWKLENGVHDDRRSGPPKCMVSSQRTLDQFENVQGVVRKLQTLRPRNEGNKRKRSLINDTEGHVLPSGIAIPPISPSIISSRRPSRSSPIQTEPIAKRTSKRPRTPTPSTSDELDPLEVVDSVEAKRGKLLQESDWVGVERQRRMSKPVKMKFTDAKDRDLIGRRRPLNGSAVQNRWNGQNSRRMEAPLMASYSEKPRGQHRGFAEEYWSAEGVSIRIGSTAMNTGPILDEMLDCYQSPGPVQGSSHSASSFKYDNTGPTPKPQHQRGESTAPSSFRNESSEPFRSLFSPEEVKPSGIAQLVEAATIADNDNAPLAEDELQLPEDYHLPEPKPGFRLVFEQTPQPRGWTSELNHRSSPIVRDFALTKGRLPGAATEQSAHPEDLNVLGEQIAEYAPVEDAKSCTSPLSIATSRYMQGLENQSYGSGGRRPFAMNMADKVATTRDQPAANMNKAEGQRGTTGDRKRKTSVQPDEIQDKENVEPTEGEGEIWRSLINLDDISDFQSRQEQPPSTHTPQATAGALANEQQVLDQASRKSNAQNAPPDDETIWRNFIFSDSGPNDEWVIEEASPQSSPDNDISTYDPARTQPSMVAEAATSPVKQNPHLMDEMRDDSPPVLDNASRHANASSSSTRSLGISSSTPQQVLHSSASPRRSSVLATASSPATHDSQSHSSDLYLPDRHHRISNPSSLIAEASSSLPTHVIRPLSPTRATHNPSPSSDDDELAWTPSRFPGPAAKEKVVFKRPSRYVGQRAGARPEPVHLGRNVNDSKKTKKTKTKTKTMSLAEAVERAKGKMGRKKGNGGRDVGHGGEEAGELGVDDDDDDDDIVDD